MDSQLERQRDNSNDEDIEQEETEREQSADDGSVQQNHKSNEETVPDVVSCPREESGETSEIPEAADVDEELEDSVPEERENVEYSQDEEDFREVYPYETRPRFVLSPIFEKSNEWSNIQDSEIGTDVQPEQSEKSEIEHKDDSEQSEEDRIGETSPEKEQNIVDEENQSTNSEQSEIEVARNINTGTKDSLEHRISGSSNDADEASPVIMPRISIERVSTNEERKNISTHEARPRVSRKRRAFSLPAYLKDYPKRLKSCSVQTNEKQAKDASAQTVIVCSVNTQTDMNEVRNVEMQTIEVESANAEVQSDFERMDSETQTDDSFRGFWNYDTPNIRFYFF